MTDLPLDDLHGKGATEALREVLTPDGYETELLIAAYENGRVDVTALWWRAPRDMSKPNDASATFEFWPERKEVVVASWDLRREADRGLTTDLNLRAPGIAREWGYETLATKGLTDEPSIPIVEGFGYEPDPDVGGRFTVALGPGQSAVERYGERKLRGE